MADTKTTRRRSSYGMSRNLRIARTKIPTIQEIVAEIAPKMAEIADLFLPGAPVTVLVRRPGDDRADVCITDDEFPELQAMLARCRARYEGTP